MPKEKTGGPNPAEPARNSSADDTGARSVRRRRGAALEAALLQAAWEELLAVGYHQLTFEAVAARADTSRTVLYRRWPHRRDLVLAALRHQTPPLPPPAPDTGALRTDVLALLGRLTLRMTQIAPVLDALADERARDSDLAHYLQDRTQQAGRAAMATVIDRAAQRGELDQASVPARVAALPFTLVVGEIHPPTPLPSSHHRSGGPGLSPPDRPLPSLPGLTTALHEHRQPTPTRHPRRGSGT